MKLHNCWEATSITVTLYIILLYNQLKGVCRKRAKLIPALHSKRTKSTGHWKYQFDLRMLQLMLQWGWSNTGIDSRERSRISNIFILNNTMIWIWGYWLSSFECPYHDVQDLLQNVICCFPADSLIFKNVYTIKFLGYQIPSSYYFVLFVGVAPFIFKISLAKSGSFDKTVVHSKRIGLHKHWLPSSPKDSQGTQRNKPFFSPIGTEKHYAEVHSKPSTMHFYHAFIHWNEWTTHI